MYETNRPIAILGAGIAGLTAAIACSACGIPYQLIETNAHSFEEGAAITLWPNALLALQKLGVFTEVPDWMHFIEHAEVCSVQNRLLYELPLHWIQGEYGFPPTCIKRSQLMHWLWGKLGYPEIRYGRCVSIAENTKGVEVRFDNGSTERYIAVIAADGIHSAVRQQLFGERKRIMNYIAWRGIAQTEKIPLGCMREYWAPGARFGYANIDRSHVYWFATLNQKLFSDNYTNAWNDMYKILHAFPKSVKACIEATPSAEILQHDIAEILPGTPMAHGKIVLIGDAAHAITPNLGLGGCLALEDAACLQQCLRNEDPIAVQFQQFAYHRKKRVSFIANVTRWLGQVTQIEHKGLIMLRDQLVRVLPADYTHFAWRYLLGDGFAESFKKVDNHLR